MDSKVTCGDIPDSGFVGQGVTFSWREPGPKLLASMMAASPLARVEAITAPVLLAVSESSDFILDQMITTWTNFCTSELSACHFVCFLFLCVILTL